jgi:ParB family transcriptional regulator, chromosome partitioning protein
MSQFYNDSIFWIDVDKIEPNPYQPRREFNQMELQSLSDSIRQYGVLQALVVTRIEFEKPEGGLGVKYELIAGERRLRASRLAGLQQVPVLIKTGDDTDLMKLELAIIENVQREDLNPVDRARAFERLAKEFGFKHVTIAQKIGKSREYVSNTLRLLALPEEILTALSEGKISEGHTRPLLMLTDRPEEQMVLYKEIQFKKLNVREAESIARRIAVDRVRKKERIIDPEIIDLEEKLRDALGTRVQIERRDVGGKVMIDFFSAEDLKSLLETIQNNLTKGNTATSEPSEQTFMQSGLSEVREQENASVIKPEESITPEIAPEDPPVIDDRSPIEKQQDDDEEIYSVSNFSI